MTDPKAYFTSETVTEGHPDKLCDQISDGVLDAMLRKIRSRASPVRRQPLQAWCSSPARSRRRPGSTSRRSCAAPSRSRLYRCALWLRLSHLRGGDLHRQAIADIDRGVSASVEYSERAASGNLSDDRAGRHRRGRSGHDDWLCLQRDADSYMPTPIELAHKLTRQLSEVRRASWAGNGPMPYLRPDGKSQVTVQYEHGKPVRIDTVVVSTQHADDVSQEQIRADVIEHIIKPVIPARSVGRADEDISSTRPGASCRRPDGRRRADGTQDHRRYLRRHGAAWRRRVLRQRSDEGGSLRRLCGALRRQEHRRGRPGGSLRDPGGLRHRRGAPAVALRRDVRHRQSLRRARSSRSSTSTSTCARRASSRRWICAARSTSRLRPSATLAAPTSIALGAARQGGGAAWRRRRLGGSPGLTPQPVPASAVIPLLR